MKKLGAIAVLTAALLSPVAFAQFSGAMSASQLQAAVQAQVSLGKSAADIATAALASGVEAGSLATAMVLAGVDPGATIGAAIRAGADAVSVMNAALAAGVPSSVVSDAARGAGVSPTVVANTIAIFGADRLASGAGGLTPGPFGPSGAGGGGTASKR